MKLLIHAMSEFLELVAPSACAACGEPNGATFCDTCRSRLRAPLPDHLIEGVPLVVAGRYDSPLSDAIVRFKYQGHPELARALASQLAPRLLGSSLPADAVLVPVPLHPKRLAERGYNQAALLAHELARTCNRRCRPRLLERTRYTARQVGKARRARLTNAADAFRVRQPLGVARALLVDDVVTTGSTVRACAQALARVDIELCAVIAVAEALGD
jgi:ComF family protein